MNYTELVASIKSYVENDFPDSIAGGLTSTQQINTFIQQAERRIYNTVQILASRKVVAISCSAPNPSTNDYTNRYLSLPSDWLSTFSLAVIDPEYGEYSYLLDKDANFIRESYPTITDTNIPQHYASIDKNTLLLGPTPNAVYNMELTYYGYPESIITAGTTWVSDNFESALLYGCLLEAYTFMKGEQDVIAGYQKRYEEALGLLKELAEGKNRQDMYRTQQVRYPVK